jgi:LPS-assembly protein
VADAAELRPDRTSEVALAGTVKITPQWTASANGRYDFEADRPSRTGLALSFRNECLSADVSLSRRYTSSTSVKPVTTVQFQLDLLGFGAGGAGPARTCRR